MFLVKFIGLVSPACVLLEPPKSRSDTMTFVKTPCSPKPSAASAGPDPRRACPWGTSRRCRRSRTRSPGWACPAPSPHPGQHASCSSLSRPPPVCLNSVPYAVPPPTLFAETCPAFWLIGTHGVSSADAVFFVRRPSGTSSSDPSNPSQHLMRGRGLKPHSLPIGDRDRRSAVGGGGQGRGCPRWRPPSTPAGFSLTSAACTRPVPRPPNLLTGLFGVCSHSLTFPPGFFVCARCSLFLTALFFF